MCEAQLIELVTDYDEKDFKNAVEEKLEDLRNEKEDEVIQELADSIGIEELTVRTILEYKGII